MKKLSALLVCVMLLMLFVCAVTAQAVTPADVSYSVMRASFQRNMVRVPKGTVLSGNDYLDYVMPGLTSAEGMGYNVMSYTDEAGNTSIVALSEVNEAGHQRYVADYTKVGEYVRTTAPRKVYVDIDSHWGKDYINYVSDRKLFGGTSETEFSPEMTMTRGMFITVLGRMHGLDATKYNNNTGYADVNSAEYYAPYITWAKETGIMEPVNATSFAPEQPILRKDMAQAIYNYLIVYNYSDLYEKYGDSLFPGAFPMEFSDLATCSDENKEAIAYIQSLGIINGVGQGKFLPEGKSTRAEVATVMQRVIKSILGVLYPAQPTENYYNPEADRIQMSAWFQWELDMKYFTEDVVKEYYDAGYNAVQVFNELARGRLPYALQLFGKYGIQVTPWNDTFTLGVNKQGEPAKNYEEKNFYRDVSEYYDHPAFAGNYYLDEPGSSTFEKAAVASNIYKKLFPDTPPFINLLPLYASVEQLAGGITDGNVTVNEGNLEIYTKHCQDYLDIFGLDYLSTDIYPFRGGTSIYDEYIEAISAAATVARDNNVEFWCYYWSYDRGMKTYQFSWQMYSLLSFGCKNFIAYVMRPYYTNGKVKLDNSFEASKPVIQEFKAISDVYVQYKNLGAFNHNYTRGASPYLKLTNQYKDFTTIKEIVSEEPLLFGCFDKKDGSAGTAFTIVNMTNPYRKLSATAKLKIDGKVTSYYGGVATVLQPDEAGYYTFELGGGEGAFVTVD